MTRLYVFAAALALSTAACAETRVYVSGVPYLCDDGYHQVGCRKDWATIKRQVRKHQREPEVRAWRQEETKPDPRCADRKPRLSVVGTEHLSVESAELAAEAAWRREVRWRHGEIYSDLKRAYMLKRGCTRSSTGDSMTAKVLEKISEDAGVLHRCEVEATPCAVQLEEVGK